LVSLGDIAGIFGWVGAIVSKADPYNGEPTWIVEPPLPGGELIRDNKRYIGTYVKDIALMPIRDLPGEDETLSWKTVPKGEYA